MPTYAKPTLVLDERRARRNIERMTEKAARLGLRFRPHFKTHQSRRIGRLFRDLGVGAITVSSVDMAAYFAADGWRDILIAFPVNVLEMADIRPLSARCRLGLLVEAADGLAVLAEGIAAPVEIWIKIDIGANRTGVDWNDGPAMVRICEEAGRRPKLRLRGLLDPQRPHLRCPDAPGPRAQPRRFAAKDAAGPPAPGGRWLRGARDLRRGHAVLSPARGFRGRRRDPAG
ncbi:MAG: alanine racemase [Candidatus Moduliflexus flocculans]|nr:alanine racemase [Candidatus Moduliflexus flocculans]